MGESFIPLRFERTDVHALLVASLAPLASQASASGVDLKLAKLGDVPSIAADREKLAWAVTALVGNALRYARREPGAEVPGSVVVHVTNAEREGEISISVQDDGPGIPEDKVPFLFERRHGASHADGLALSLVRQVAAAHRGRIEVESRREPDEHGTSITIVLPVATSPA